MSERAKSILPPMTEAQRAAWEASKPRPYDLADPAERVRLLRETVGYAMVSINRRDGTDRPGREFAYDALKQALALGYRLVPPGDATP